MNSLWLTLQSNTDLLAAITYLITIISVPIIVTSYVFNSFREKDAYDRAVHERLDTPYYSYLQYCVNYPELDIGEFPLSDPIELSDIEIQKQRAIYSHLMSLFETAYILYARSRSSTRKKQWAGWDAYIASYCSRPNFRAAWIEGRGLYIGEGNSQAGSTLDKSFDAYMTRKIKHSPLSGLPPTIETEVS